MVITALGWLYTSSLEVNSSRFCSQTPKSCISGCEWDTPEYLLHQLVYVSLRKALDIKEEEDYY